MQKLVVCALAVLLSFAWAAASEIAPTCIGDAKVADPLLFTPNLGQWDSKVLYRACAGAATLWFTSDGVYIQFSDFGKNIDVERGAGRPEPTTVDIELVKITFQNCKVSPVVEASDLVDYKCNFFLGNDPSHWRTDVPSYASITYRDIYPGIDLCYYSTNGLLEYDYIVRPGADPAIIRTMYETPGVMELLPSGEVVVRTRLGEISESQPRCRQATDLGSREFAGQFRLLGSNTFTFEIPQNVRADKEMTIDPIMKFSTYLGGSSSDEAYAIDASSSGSPYVTGQTASADFPFVSGYDNSLTGTWDLFVTKFANNGTSLVYSTYIGGSGNELGRDIHEDGYGEVGITGYTTSNNYPLNLAFDNTLGGSRDAFVTLLNSSGNGLILSTYVGGSSDDDGFGVIADGSNLELYATGWTASSDFPTSNAYDATYNGGNDAFAVKITLFGGLGYGTYIGGSGSDIGWELAIDANYDAYIAGLTSSNNFPTVNAYDATANGGNDVFACKLSSSGNTLIYSTYIGGSGNDQGLGIDVDGSGNAYVCGLTSSSNYPTANAYDATYNGGYDINLTKLNSNGNGLLYSTFIGGSSHEYAYAVCVDSKRQVYLCGRTESSNFPLVNPTDNSYNGNIDAYVTKVATAGTSLAFSTFLGGSGQDLGLGLGIDVYCNAYAAGSTTSTDFQLANPYDNTRNGTYDAFVTKLTPYLCGDFNGDGVVNATDATDYSNYFIYGGSIPCPIEASDANGDGINLTIADLVYLVNYLNLSGPPPVCP